MSHAMAVSMMVVMILIACMAMLFALGAPLLLAPDSPVPDIIGFVVLTLMVAAGIWATGAWWVLAAVLALVILMVWMDRPGPAARDPAVEADLAAISPRARTRLRLWRAAMLFCFALIVAFFALPAAGIGLSLVQVIVPLMVVALTAMSLFRFSFYRMLRRDEQAVLEGAA